MSDFNQQVIDEFRSNGGRVEMFGDVPIVIVHVIGAKSGKDHPTPLVAIVEDEVRYVIASAGGSPTHPDWYHNLKANPDVVIERGTENSIVTEHVRATELGEPERTEVFARMAGQMPQFNDYVTSAAPRTIPVFELRLR